MQNEQFTQGVLWAIAELYRGKYDGAEFLMKESGLTDTDILLADECDQGLLLHVWRNTRKPRPKIHAALAKMG